MSRAIKRHDKDARAFCEGAWARVNGSTDPNDNPYPSGFAEQVAWNDGWWAAFGPNVWAASTGYLQGQQVRNSGSVYCALNGGTSAADSGPSGKGPTVADNDITWQYIGEGTTVDLGCCNIPRADSGPMIPVWRSI